jgi:acyl carrier protein
MSDDTIRETVLRLLGEVAPEMDPSTIDPTVRLRDQIDIDSMDALNFLISVDAEWHLDIPEADYPKLTTLENIVEYIEAGLAAHR